MSRREQIAMSDEEVAAFLDEQRVMVCATNGRDGWPHLMPLWYVVRDGELWAWTYAKSQKVRNLERDAHATVEVETGEAYDELRGVMIKAQAVIHRETDVVAELGAEIFRRYSQGQAAVADDFLDTARAQAAKRVGLQLIPQDLASWDHRKLEGVY
ncbi:MAG: pyridoxamine 5'-phosphate oxidase family protein [Solirubrobacteraceae bacterium]